MPRYIRFRTIHPTDREKSIRYVEWDRDEKLGRAYYCDPETGERSDSAADSLSLGSEEELGWRMLQWVNDGDTIVPGWE